MARLDPLHPDGRVRLWDDTFNNCLYDSHTDGPLERFLGDLELNFTIDYPPDGSWRTRRGGKIAKAGDEIHWYEHRELAEHLLQWPTLGDVE